MKWKSRTGKEMGGRCVNVRSGHGSKGHQLKSGKVFFVGEYESSFSVESFQEEFRLQVYDILVQLLRELRETVTESRPEFEVAADIHRNTVLKRFYDHVTANQGHDGCLVNHSTCFCCLMGSPEHSLPCGHIICTPCLLVYGSKLERDVVEMTYCPLHSSSKSAFPPWKIFHKPEAAGVRVLSLDGGGVRGIVDFASHRTGLG